MNLSEKAARWVAAAVALSGPVTAQAQAPTAYDGSYIGVSATLIPGGRETRSCQTLAAPPTLTIASGVVHIPWGTGPINGPVGAQGTITLKNDYQSRLTAQIDPQGNIKGTIGAQCTYTSVWRKR
jgi:hypothetical protein